MGPGGAGGATVTIPAGTTPAGATVTFTISSDSQPTRLDVVQGTVAR